MELSIMQKNDIDKQVSILLHKQGYNSTQQDYVDIVNFAQNLGFIIGQATLPDNEDGFLLIRPQDKKDSQIIAVNKHRSLEWKRFIIAHEVAHFILHYNVGTAYIHRENVKGKDERENDADYFAAALLMPNDSFKRVHNKLVKDGLKDNALYIQLASVFKVPLGSVTRRISELSLCDST